MPYNHKQKPKNVDYFQVLKPLWQRIKKLFVNPKKKRGKGRRPADTRAVLNRIWYTMWTGCGWKAVKREWFGCQVVCYMNAFRHGIFAKIMKMMLKFYNKHRKIEWKWK